MSSNSEEQDLLKELGKILNDIQEFTQKNIADPVNKFADENIKKPLNSNFNINLLCYFIIKNIIIVHFFYNRMHINYIILRIVSILYIFIKAEMVYFF